MPSQSSPMKSAQEEEDPIKRLIREAEAAQKAQAEASAKQEEEEDPIKRLIREAEAAAAAGGGGNWICEKIKNVLSRRGFS